MSGEPGDRFDRWKDLVGSFFGILPELDDDDANDEGQVVREEDLEKSSEEEECELEIVYERVEVIEIGDINEGFDTRIGEDKKVSFHESVEHTPLKDYKVDSVANAHFTREAAQEEDDDDDDKLEGDSQKEVSMENSVAKSVKKIEIIDVVTGTEVVENLTTVSDINDETHDVMEDCVPYAAKLVTVVVMSVDVKQVIKKAEEVTVRILPFNDELQEDSEKVVQIIDGNEMDEFCVQDDEVNEDVDEMGQLEAKDVAEKCDSEAVKLVTADAPDNMTDFEVVDMSVEVEKEKKRDEEKTVHTLAIDYDDSEEESEKVDKIINGHEKDVICIKEDEVNVGFNEMDQLELRGKDEESKSTEEIESECVELYKLIESDGDEDDSLEVKCSLAVLKDVSEVTVERENEQIVENTEDELKVEKLIDSVMRKSDNVIDIEDANESDEDIETNFKFKLAPSLNIEANEAVEMMIELILAGVPYNFLSKGVVVEEVMPSDDPIAVVDMMKPVRDEDKVVSVSPSTTHKYSGGSWRRDHVKPPEAEQEITALVDEPVPLLVIGDNLNTSEAAKDSSAPIDARMVSFACLDVRLKTGFPAKVVKKVTNCVSIVLNGLENEVITGTLGHLGCGADKVKFYSQSKMINNQVRKDLVFETEIEAAEFYEFTLSKRLKSFLLSESELGYLSAPVLSEAEMLYIMTTNQREKNLMTMFDGKVEQDMEGKIQFEFSSLASLNLFLHSIAGPDNSSLGLLRLNLTNEKPAVLQGVVQRKGDCEMFRLNVVHSEPLRVPRIKKDNGWHWDLLQKTCDFKIDQCGANSKTRKVLTFKTKLSLFQFWTGVTGKLFEEGKLENLKMKIEEFEVDESGTLLKKKELAKTDMKKKLNKQDALPNHAIDNLSEKPVDKLNQYKLMIGEIEAKKDVSESVLHKKEVKDIGMKEKLNETDQILQQEILSRKSLEIELKKLVMQTDELKEQMKIKSTRIETLERELKKERQVKAKLVEKLANEEKGKKNLEVKIAHQEMEKKIQDEIARRTLENQLNALANYDTSRGDYFYDRRNLYGNGRNSSSVVRSIDTTPQISLTSVLSLTWRNEDENGTNYVSCLWKFLRGISSALQSVIKLGEEIFLKFYSKELLTKALLKHATEDGRDYTRLSHLKQRARVIADDLFDTYHLTMWYTEENFHLQSKMQLLDELKRAGGRILRCKEAKVTVAFSTLIAYVRALTIAKLAMHHRMELLRSQVEVFGRNGENNFYMGSVCLTESNLLSIHFIGEEEAGYAECFSNFMKNPRIMNVDLGRNLRLLITFYSLGDLNTSLQEYCQISCNTLHKLVNQPVRCKLVPRNTFYSLLCPSTAVKQDFLSYRNLCRWEVEARRISSKSKLCLVQILRDADVQWKYPEIHFTEDNFLCKAGRPLPKTTQAAVVHVPDDYDVHALEDDGPPADLREITSDYEESVLSEAAGGVDGKH